MWSPVQSKAYQLGIITLLLGTLVGCRSYGPANLIPAQRVLNASCCRPEEEAKINFMTLRRDPPEEYVLDKGDVLGIWVQGITGAKDVPPPVHFPDKEGGEPALGYPVPVRDNGTISLPMLAPIQVSGLTVGQAEEKIIKAYTDNKILLKENAKTIVTLMKRRTYNVLVIREDISTRNSNQNLNRNQVYIDEAQQNETYSIELPAYENDVLHALSETGGLPGERAKNEIIILRKGMQALSQNSEGIVELIGNAATGQASTLDQANIVRIPIKGDIGSFPQLSEADITLEDGDVVYIEGRQRDVFYTGGLLEGGRFPLPRDYDINVLEAMAMAGGSVSSAAGTGNGLTGRGGIMPATKVTILRKCGCQHIAIEVDLRCALADASERVIIQPGDLIVLEYRRKELIVNSLASILRYGGIFRLFN